jgi:hypothetical protein
VRKNPDQVGFAINPRRWVVERFFAWIGRNPEWRVSSDYLLTDVIGLPKERQNNNHTKRLASLMRGLGWDRNESVMRIGSGVARGFTQKRKDTV